MNQSFFLNQLFFLQHEYFDRYPRGLNPVKINDIVFAVHAAFATLVTIVQCFVYERQDQKVSFTARGIMGVFAAFLTISIILAACKVILWLDFLYYCSYVKLTITLIKYVPQVRNEKNKTQKKILQFLTLNSSSWNRVAMRLLVCLTYDFWRFGVWCNLTIDQVFFFSLKIGIILWFFKNISTLSSAVLMYLPNYCDQIFNCINKWTPPFIPVMWHPLILLNRKRGHMTRHWKGFETQNSKMTDWSEWKTDLFF